MMNTRIISIIVGLVLVMGTGTLVYVTKKPASVLPVINPAPVNTVAPTQGVTPKKSQGADEDEYSDDEDDRPAATKPAVVPVTTPVPVVSTPVTQPAESGITLAQISSHNSAASCWSAINGTVYDLTSWIPNHPGGEGAILSLCGIDGSAGYNGQHGGSSRTARILGGFKIGVYTK